MSKVKINGLVYDRIPCGEKDNLDYNKDGNPCKDCGVQIGEYHAPYCEAEQCPIFDNCDNAPECGGQLCGCALSPEYIEE